MLLHHDWVEKRIRQTFGDNQYLRKIRSNRGKIIHGKSQKEHKVEVRIRRECIMDANWDNFKINLIPKLINIGAEGHGVIFVKILLTFTGVLQVLTYFGPYNIRI